MHSSLKMARSLRGRHPHREAFANPGTLGQTLTLTPSGGQSPAAAVLQKPSGLRTLSGKLGAQAVINIDFGGGGQEPFRPVFVRGLSKAGRYFARGLPVFFSPLPRASPAVMECGSHDAIIPLCHGPNVFLKGSATPRISFQFGPRGKLDAKNGAS